MNPILKSSPFAIVSLIGIVIAIYYIDSIQLSSYQAQERALVSEKLFTLRTRLESRLNRSMSYAIALRSFVLSRLAQHKPIKERDFTAFAKSLPNKEKTVVGLQLAPNSIIGFVYPESDKSLIGADLNESTRSNATVQRAISTRLVIVDGPRMLSQKKMGLVVRYPIFEAKNKFWGFATVLIDFNQLLKVSDIGLVTNGLELSIRGKDGMGSQGEVFFGNADLFSRETIKKYLSFENGKWQIAVLPQDDWSSSWPARPVFLSTSLFIALVIIFLIWRNSLHKQLLAINELRLQVLATKDSLTQLANRRALQTHLEDEWRRAVRAKTSLSVLMLDIDHFKAYNDYYGHLKGDSCICTIANEVQISAKRPADLAARFGGEEFVLVLPDTHLYDAVNIAEELRSKIYSHKIPHADKESIDFISVSIGVASCQPLENANTEKTVQNLLNTADKELYKAKNNGRNRVSNADV